MEGAVPEAAGSAVWDAGGEDCAGQEGVPVAQVRDFVIKPFGVESLDIAGDDGASEGLRKVPIEKLQRVACRIKRMCESGRRFCLLERG